MNKKVSIVSNVSLNDLYRIRHIVPHWIRIFNANMVNELILVLDRMPASGRIASLHRYAFNESQILEELERVKSLDSRVKVIDLEYAQLNDVGLKWFGKKGVNRCQAGTPIFPFLFGIEQASNNIIIKLDSDMVFYDLGIIDSVVSDFSNDGELSLISLPRFRNPPSVFSTRAFAINFPVLSRLFPLPFISLDPFRTLQRLVTGQVPFRAMEVAIEMAIQSGELKHFGMNQDCGSSLHVSLSWWPGLARFESWLKSIELGEFPVAQDNWDFVVSAWER